MRIVYLIIVIIIFAIIISSIFLKSEKFQQEIKDQANIIINNTTKSIADFDTIYSKIKDISNKSPLLEDIYTREKSVNDKNKSVNDLIKKTTTLINCDDGNYINVSTGDCETCKNGGFCVNGKFSQCQGNAYTDKTGQSECTICPQGSSSYGYNGTKCVKCLNGTYIDVRFRGGVIKKCQSCGSGNINDGEGNMNCSLCPINYYCTEFKYDKTIDINESLASRKNSCPSGSYTDTMGNYDVSQCKTCASGKLGVGCINNCPAGKYCKTTRISDSIVDEKIYDCPENTYNNKTGSFDVSDCKPCPPGMFSTIGSSECKNIEDCPDGYYIEGKKWVICPEGYYCTKGIKTPCENGKWSTVGSSTCTICPTDSMCRNGVKKLRSTPEKITDCLDGYFYDTTTSKCVLCSTSFSCTKGIKTQCNNTPGLSQYYDTLSNTCKLCPIGYLCKDGKLSVCPKGQNTDDADGKALTGQTSCSPCPKGVLCDNGLKTICPSGQSTINHSSITECISCDPGYYRDSSIIPTRNNNGGYCFATDNPSDSKTNKCPPGYICPVITNPDKTKATVKTLCDKDKDNKALYSEALTNTCKICPAGSMCNNGIKTNCGQDRDSFGNIFDLKSYDGATKCTRPNGYLCPTNSGDCLSGCCGRTGWYDVSNKCQNKEDVAYGCL
jgi:hypothetical protein